MIDNLKKAFDRTYAKKPKSGKPVRYQDKFCRIEGQKEEVERAKKLVERLSKSEHGRDLLTRSQGYIIRFVSGMEKTEGACNHRSHSIKLNPEISDEKLVTVLAHEMRHAVQNKHGAADRLSSADFKTRIMQTRALEADAEANAALCAYELGQAGDKEVADAFYASNRFSLASVSKQSKAGAGKEEMLTAGFKGWFTKNKFKGAYENILIFDLEKKAEQKNFYSGELSKKSSEEILNAACQLEKGKSYFKDDLNLLAQDGYIDINEKTAIAIYKYQEKAAKAGVTNKDKSLSEIPVRKIPSKFMRGLEGYSVGKTADTVTSGKIITPKKDRSR